MGFKKGSLKTFKLLNCEIDTKHTYSLDVRHFEKRALMTSHMNYLQKNNILIYFPTKHFYFSRIKTEYNHV